MHSQLFLVDFIIHTLFLNKLKINMSVLISFKLLFAKKYYKKTELSIIPVSSYNAIDAMFQIFILDNSLIVSKLILIL